MKRVLLVSLGLIAIASYAGCLPEEGTPTGTGGKGGANPQGMAGTTGQAGSDATAGTSGDAGAGGGAGDTATAGTGGSTPATAGTGGSSSTAGTGGSTSTAGTGGGSAGRGGTGGSTAGTGGGSAGRGGTGGSTAGTGGGSAGRGGTTGVGGSTAGTTGTAGTGGGTGALPTIPELFPVTSTTVGSFDGRLLVMPCGDNNDSGTDCGGGGAYYMTAGAGTTAQRITCTGSALNVNQVFNVGGETGRMYQVSVHFYGIAEPKVYGNNVTREAGTGRPANTEDTTGAGATPTAWATAAGGHTYTASDYNTNEVRVCRTRACATADETAVYYLNADTSQGHWSYVLNYEKTITVIGGGSIRVRNYDQNCREIKNCGPANVAASACATMSNRRVINLAAAMPTPSTSPAAMGGLAQPGLIPERSASSAGQWLLIDVTRVISVQ